MEPDPRTQSRLAQVAQALESSANAIDAAEVRSRAAHVLAARDGRQPWIVAVAALAALLVAATVVVVDGGSGRHKITTGRRPPEHSVARRPHSIIAVKSNDVVELDSADGSQRRVIASNVGPFGVDGLSLVDTSTAIVGGVGNPQPCLPDLTVGIWGTIDLSSGVVQPAALGETVEHAFSAVVSPDGGRVAYVEQRCGAAQRLVVSDPAGGVIGSFTAPVRAGADLQITGVAGWDGDGHHLVVELVDGLLSNPQHEWLYVDMSDYTSEAPRGQQSVLHGTAVPTVPDLVQLAPLGVPHRWAAMIGGVESGSSARVVEYDLASGAIVRDLADWDRRHAIVRIAAADASGQHVLVLVTPNVQALKDGNLGSLLVTGAPVLYRWDEGKASLTKLMKGVSAAAWLPTTER